MPEIDDRSEPTREEPDWVPPMVSLSSHGRVRVTMGPFVVVKAGPMVPTPHLSRPARMIEGPFPRSVAWAKADKARK